MNEYDDDTEAAQFWESAFGRDLFNLYTLKRDGGLLFSHRAKVVRVMLQSMVIEEHRIRALIDATARMNAIDE